MAPIASIQGIHPGPSPLKITPPAAGGEPGLFQTMFRQSVAGVEQSRVNAEQSVTRFLSGDGEEVHKVALATQQAELSFEMFMQVRNKVVQAYQEIMRMQV